MSEPRNDINVLMERNSTIKIPWRCWFFHSWAAYSEHPVEHFHKDGKLFKRLWVVKICQRCTATKPIGIAAEVIIPTTNREECE